MFYRLKQHRKIIAQLFCLSVLLLFFVQPTLSLVKAQSIQARPIEAIVVPENEEWLLALAAPILASHRPAQAPLLLSLAKPLAIKESWMLKQVAANRCLVLATKNSFSSKDFKDTKVDMIPLVSNPMQAGITLAQLFWKNCDEVVLASFADKASMVHGATLATHLKVPFIPVQEHKSFLARLFKKESPEQRELIQALQHLKVKRVWVAVGDVENKPGWAAAIGAKVHYLDDQAISRRIIEKIGVASVKHLLLIRTPDEWVGKTSWLAPYYSLVRQAPIIFSSTAGARQAEDGVYAFIDTHRIDPRFLTILANYEAIGVIPLNDPALLGEYQVEVEPCTLPPMRGYAIALASGRIPCNDLRDASLLIARTFARKRLLAHLDPHVLMVANPASEYGTLPLAETIAHATAQEYKNCRVKIDEFYNVRSDTEPILQASDKSHLIIFQGHASDQFLFVPENPANFDISEVPVKNRKKRRLSEFPVVILQSCSSLEEPMFQLIFNCGGIGLIGSVTSIHSASGSAFIKAFSDSMLYRGDTVGEAMRSARNYFLCLAELKNRRGHKETPKLRRVALSFRLWGDPQLQLLPEKPNKPIHRPLKAQFTKNHHVQISVPRRRLPKSETKAYVAQTFPGSELAGIVKRVKGKPQRRITPLYFLRLHLPKKFKIDKYRDIRHPEDPGGHGVFLADPYRQFVYLLYYPPKEQRGKKIELRFYPDVKPYHKVVDKLPEKNPGPAQPPIIIEENKDEDV